ncbi:DUF3106 domain-containing protein [Candidatus Accumulibacter sp. ACC003]|uniref:DUF3106 domain-containing protein n=1 Tax=Candidatus Accumulibacter sp. ACC003 TaxID=2823334 RepID=UPI0025C4DFCE|nr:DUF3106 domain-containing protein [Candidatus Accumulibacter sp. ACC003]
MAEKLRVAIILCSFVAVTGWADTLSPSAIATPAQPQWSELTVEQKIILAPLGYDWDAMDYPRQKKWLGITRRFFNMTPEEQRRIQGQMQDWGKLTPEQRRVARENFLNTSKLPVEKKQELRQKWEQYSSLPEEEKERLQQEAARKPAPKPGQASGSAAGLPPAGSATRLPLAGRPPSTLPASVPESRD